MKRGRGGGRRRIRMGAHLAYRGAGVPDKIPADAVLELRVSLLRMDPRSPR